MDHFEAVNNQAVEQYLLGQMPEAEIEEFEQHFFECGICAEEVQSGIVFQENARAAFAAAPRPEPAPAKRNWLAAWWPKPAFAVPAFAAALLAVVVVYQAGFEIPALRQQIAQSAGRRLSWRLHCGRPAAGQKTGLPFRPERSLS